METTLNEVRAEKPQSTRDWIQQYGLYALALAAAISVWLQVIRAPLFLDETGSYWQISRGLGQIWARQRLHFPAYSFILWLWTRVFGTSEAAMRSLSVLAMAGAAYLLYRAAREMFNRELSLIAVLIFCIHPMIVIGAVLIRPYAFAVLATNAAIFALLRLREDDSTWMAALFGLLAALIVYFHYLFAAILPAFVACFFVLKRGADRKVVWRQFWIAAAVFTLAFLPVIPGVHYMVGTSGEHVYDPAPVFADVIWTFAPGFLPFVVGGAVVVAMVIAAKTRRQPDAAETSDEGRSDNWRPIVCALLGLVPLLILYGVSAWTPIHMFETRHRLVAVPGIALCWILVIGTYLRRATRLLLCAGIILALGFQYYWGPQSTRNSVTWKYAVEELNREASADNAPVVMCSSFAESDYAPMPVDSVKSSEWLAPLSYYKLNEPVVALPKGLNAQAIRLGSQFLEEATAKHKRFFAAAETPSYPTLDWLAKNAAGAYNVRNLGIYGGEAEVLEFDPREFDPRVK